MERRLTCIICPRGCQLTAQGNGDGSVSVEGNLCPRGKKYATDELTAPVRTVTSTMFCDDGSLVSVKTSVPIPKEKMAECMRIINSGTAHLPVKIGDVLIRGVFGADIVATQNKE